VLAVPVSDAVTVPPGEALTAREADFAPTVAGLRITVSVQVAFGARFAPVHASVTGNSPLVVPVPGVKVTLSTPVALAPVFDTVKICGALDAPTRTERKSCEVGEMPSTPAEPSLAAAWSAAASSDGAVESWPTFPSAVVTLLSTPGETLPSSSPLPGPAVKSPRMLEHPATVRLIAAIAAPNLQTARMVVPR
jgi:hypothetical protein